MMGTLSSRRGSVRNSSIHAASIPGLNATSVTVSAESMRGMKTRSTTDMNECVLSRPIRATSVSASVSSSMTPAAGRGSSGEGALPLRVSGKMRPVSLHVGCAVMPSVAGAAPGVSAATIKSSSSSGCWYLRRFRLSSEDSARVACERAGDGNREANPRADGGGGIGGGEDPGRELSTGGGDGGCSDAPSASVTAVGTEPSNARTGGTRSWPKRRSR